MKLRTAFACLAVAVSLACYGGLASASDVIEESTQPVETGQVDETVQLEPDLESGAEEGDQADVPDETPAEEPASEGEAAESDDPRDDAAGESDNATSENPSADNGEAAEPEEPSEPDAEGADAVEAEPSLPGEPVEADTAEPSTPETAAPETLQVEEPLILGPATYALSGGIRGTDVSVPDDGDVFILIDGEYFTCGADAAIKRINEIRYEAVQLGLATEYVPIKWSYELEWIAQIRAAEGTLVMDHIRPSGWWCFSATYGGVGSSAENLAWNGGSMLQAIEQWYAEKDAYINQTPGAVTGHYTSLINPGYRSIGLGGFSSSRGGWSCVAAEFSGQSNLTQAQTGDYGACRQVVELDGGACDSLEVNGEAGLLTGKTTQLGASLAFHVGDYWGGTSTKTAALDSSAGVTWTSSDASVATVSSSGLVSAKKAGKATITASIPSMGLKGTYTVTVSDISVKLESTASIVYDGTQKKPALKVTSGSTVLKQGTDYTVAYSNNVNAGTARAVVTGKGAYASSSAEITFKIEKAIFDNASIGRRPSAQYTGATVAAVTSVTLGGRTLVEGTDYTLDEYDDKVVRGVGLYYVAVVPNYDNFTSSGYPLYYPFRVEPLVLKDSHITLSATSYKYDGKAKQPAVTVKAGSLTLKQGTDYTVAYSNNVAAGTATVTVTGKGNCSGTVKKTFQIAHRLFDDTPDNSWYVTGGYIDYVLEKGLMTGYEGGKLFGPEDNITRGQVATVLFRIANPGSNATGSGASSQRSKTFTDVPNGVYYTAAVEWCYANGIVTGYAGTKTFGPDDPVTREQLATMLYRFGVWQGAASSSFGVKVSRFPDRASISSFALQGMSWCSAKGILSGDGVTGMAMPQATATRAQMAKMLTVLVRDVL